MYHVIQSVVIQTLCDGLLSIVHQGGSQSLLLPEHDSDMCVFFEFMSLTLFTRLEKKMFTCPNLNACETNIL